MVKYFSTTVSLPHDVEIEIVLLYYENVLVIERSSFFPVKCFEYSGGLQGLFKLIVCLLWSESADDMVNFSRWFGFFSHTKKSSDPKCITKSLSAHWLVVSGVGARM